MKKYLKNGVVAFNDNRSYQLLLLIMVISLAAVLRFYKLGEWSFWGDEYITVRKAIDVFGGGITRMSPSMLLTHVVLTTQGVSEWNARLISVLAGIVTVPVLYWLVRRLYDSYVAIIASLLLAIAPWHIYWSQNARFYTTLLLFYTLALLFFYWALEEDRPGFMFLSLTFFGIASIERLISGFLVPTLVGYLILLKLFRFEMPRGLHWRNLAIYFVPGFIAMVGLVVLNPSIQDPSRGLRSFGFVNNNPVWILSGAAFYIGVPLICMSVFGAISLLMKRERIGLLLSLAAVVPLASLMLISFVQYTANRYAFVSLTSMIILAAYAVKEILVMMPRQGKVFAVGVLVILIVVPMTDNILYFQYQNGNRDNWKDAFTLISDEFEEGDQVITASRALADYYLQTETIGMQSVEVAGIEEVVKDTGRTWIVIDVTADGKGPTISRWALHNARYVKSFDVNISARTFPMAVYLYDPAGSSTESGVVTERP
ncbi:MAG: glycosyltransferase family 39 protein [Chloroflexi bacterium]|nr:glycosyltransferase family 39 protein [Chloroflexota bacterium]